MTRSEVIKLMENIKVFYHNFSYPPDLVEAWYERLKDIPYESAKKNLDRYVSEDEIGRMPTIARIMRVSASGKVDKWKSYRENMELSYYDEDTFIDNKNRYLWAYPKQD